VRLLFAAVAAFFVLAVSAAAGQITSSLSIVEPAPYLARQTIHAVATMSGQNGRPSVRLECVREPLTPYFAELGILFLHVGFDLPDEADCVMTLGYYRAPRHVKYVPVETLEFHVNP